MNVFCAEVPLVMSVKWYICSARGCSMRLSKLYNFRDSHLLYCLYVFLSSVILWYMEALGLKKFLTKGQTWNPKCLHSQLVYQLYLRLFQGIFLYNFESVHQVCAYTLEFLGCDFYKSWKVHESTRASLAHQVLLLRHNC